MIYQHKVVRSLFLSSLLVLMASIIECQQNLAQDVPVQPESVEQESLDEMLERIQRRREERKQKEWDRLFNNFEEKYGYNPRDYEVKYRISGDNVTVFGKSDWMKLTVKPEEQTINVAHSAATRDIFWGTMVWHDHEMINVSFLLDEEACQKFSDGVNCEFSGKDSVTLPNNFLEDHQIFKRGQWTLTYIEKSLEKSVTILISPETMPSETHEEVKYEQVNSAFCRAFPEGLDCK